MNAVIIPRQERTLTLALGRTVTSAAVEHQQFTWAQFLETLRHPKRSSETAAVYDEMTREEQSALKDVGHFVPGRFAADTRRGESLQARDAVALDFDHVPTGIDFLARLRASDLGSLTWAAHTTRKHRAKSPRWRLLIPLAQSVSREAYEPLARDLAKRINIEWADQTTYEWARVMHWPSVCLDGEFLCEVNDGIWLDPEMWLEEHYLEWRDATEWPVSSREAKELRQTRKKLGPPGEKPGLIGAFCRVYDILGAIERYLPGVYLEGASSGRLSYARGSGANGAVLYDNNQFLFSHHESDPAGHRCVNAFDLVRIHRFGSLDAECDPATPMQDRPSHRAMAGLAAQDAAVMAELQRESTEDFRDFDTAPEGSVGAGEATTPSHVHAPRDALPHGVRLIDFWYHAPTARFLFAPTRDLWSAASVDRALRLKPTGEQGASEAQASESEAPSAERRSGAKAKKKAPPLASAWLARHRRVEQTSWAPGEPQIIDGRLLVEGGWIERPGFRAFNLYLAPTLKRGDPAKAGPWLDHVRRVYPSEAEHIIVWLAHRVQRPGEKINHALVLGGEQGIGKDTLLEPARRAVGEWNFAEVSPTQLLGRFNGFLKSVILRVSEARDLGDASRFGFYEHMKTLVAAPPDVHRIDEKNLREYHAANVCGVILTTNHKTGGFYLPADDRRHFVAWSERTKEDFDGEYWSRLWRWYEEDGAGHVGAYLAALDLSEFDAKAPPPKTPAWFEIVNASRAPEDAEMTDLLDSLEWPAAVTVEMLIRAARERASLGGGGADFAAWLADRRNRRQLPHRFEEAGYLVARNAAAQDGLWRIGGRRTAVYARGELSPRERMAAAGALAEGARESAGLTDFDGE